MNNVMTKEIDKLFAACKGLLEAQKTAHDMHNRLARKTESLERRVARLEAGVGEGEYE